MFKIRDRTEEQILMDQCTGKLVIHLRAASLAMEKSYSRLNLYRAGVLSACIFSAGTGCAPAIQTFNSVARIERQIQKAIQLYWNEQRTFWGPGLKLKCNLPIWIGRSPFPQFPYSILAEGTLALGDIQNLQLREPVDRIQLKLFSSRLVSVAELRKDRNAWKVAWTQ